jgi:hypothetical protein
MEILTIIFAALLQLVIWYPPFDPLLFLILDKSLPVFETHFFMFFYNTALFASSIKHVSYSSLSYPSDIVFNLACQNLFPLVFNSKGIETLNK